MIRWPGSLRLRMAVAFTVIVGTTLTLVGVLTFQLLRQNLLDGIERDVVQRVSAFADAEPSAPYDLDTFGAPDVFLQVSDADGEPLARSDNLGGKTLPVMADVAPEEVVEIHLADRPLFYTWAPIDSERRILVARSPITTYGALRSLREMLVIVIGGAVVLTSIISWLYARGALRPVGQVVDAARAVRDSKDLSQRVPHRGTRDEVGRLGHTFNEMLAELEQAYRSLDGSNQQLRRFLADCSHELRAPLARIRSTVDLLERVGESGDSDDGFSSRALADIAADTDRMARMVRQLLILARADAGASIEPRPARLDEVVEHACRQAARMADGVRFHPPPSDTLADALVLGDADLLEQLLLILLDNAFKYTPGAGEVSVTAGSTNGEAQITVTDTGLGVPPEDVERIFERFYRGRNASTATGTGLGLAIAAWIADQHGGEIEHAHAPGGGSEFTLHLPLEHVSSVRPRADSR